MRYRIVKCEAHDFLIRSGLTSQSPLITTTQSGTTGTNLIVVISKEVFSERLNGSCDQEAQAMNHGINRLTEVSELPYELLELPKIDSASRIQAIRWGSRSVLIPVLAEPHRILTHNLPSTGS